ncbi:MAG TPA: serine hydrolase domain-containing protein [Gemmatimonadales bacterium]|nr:serine hydrolase domain-containing protein [Gemmatimonadales bacterium]
MAVSVLCALATLSTLQAGPPAKHAATLPARLDSLVRAYVARGEFSGVVLVAARGAIVYQHAFGEANREWHVPNTIATRFRIASTTKQFTAALVLRLVESGKLRLDGHIVDYLPDYPRPQGEQITLEHLLTHSSGLPDYPGLPRFYEDHATRAHTTRELLALFDTLPLAFPPGSKWEYSNSGYVVLGAIIERVTDTTYAAALRQHLLIPLGLNDTGYDDPAEITERRASGYIRTADGVRNAPFIDPSTVFSAGMLRSSAHDLLRWAELLRAGRVFRDTADAAAMVAPHLPTGLPLGAYGYGVFIGTQSLGGRPTTVIQHGGTIYGFTSGFWRMPSEDCVVIVLDNHMSHQVPALTAGLADVLYSTPRAGSSPGDVPRGPPAH